MTPLLYRPAVLCRPVLPFLVAATHLRMTQRASAYQHPSTRAVSRKTPTVTPKKRKSKSATSYSNLTVEEAEKRLGFRMRSVRRISVERMLANAKHSLSSGGEWSDIILKTKERVYDNVAEYIAIEGYPMEGSPDFKEASIHHLVYAAISPMIGNFIRMTGSESIQLQSEKGIASTDGETGGVEEFVVMDLVSVDDEKFILIVEAKRSSLGQAMKQSLLAMKDMRDNNGGVGEVCGFVPTGESWRMISYDGMFQTTNKIDLVFDTMGDEREK